VHIIDAVNSMHRQRRSMTGAVGRTLTLFAESE
jgi:hypothetical protein